MLFAAYFSLIPLENIQARAFWKELPQGNNQCWTKTIPTGAAACIFLLCCALLSFQCDISSTESSSDCVTWKLMFSRPLSSLLRAQMFSFPVWGWWPWPTPTDNWQRWLQSQGVISGCKVWQTKEQIRVLGGRQKKPSQQLTQPDCEGIKMLKSWCIKLLGRSSYCSRQIYSKYLYTVHGDVPHRHHYRNICQNALIMG